MDHQVSVSVRTPFDMYTEDLFYAELHVHIQAQPAPSKKLVSSFFHLAYEHSHLLMSIINSDKHENIWTTCTVQESKRKMYAIEKYLTPDINNSFLGNSIRVRKLQELAGLSKIQTPNLQANWESHSYSGNPYRMPDLSTSLHMKLVTIFLKRSTTFIHVLLSKKHNIDVPPFHCLVFSTHSPSAVQL